MYKGQSVAVVVPAYNEEEHVGEVIDTVPEFVDRIYPVDDCSTDDTWAVMRSRAGARVERAAAGSVRVSPRADGGSDDQTVVPLRHETNRGVGAAIKTGYNRAVSDGVDAVAVLNGDGQMDPDILDRVLDPVVDGRAGYAKGDRLFNRDARRQMPFWRFFGNALLTFLTKLSSGYLKTNDPQNGYTAVAAETLERIPLDTVYEDYGFLNDMLTVLNIHDVTIANVPHDARYGDEESGISYATFVPALSTLLLKNFVRRLTAKHLVRDFHPLVFCYALGAGGLLSTAVVGVVLLLLAVGGTLGLASVVATLVLLLISGLTLSIAIAFDVAANEHLELVAGR